MIIRVFDTETTGIPAPNDPHALVQVGWCDVEIDEGGVFFGGPKSALCNPGRPIPAEASAIHHIIDEDVADAIDPTEALALLMKPPTYDPIDVFAAHNVAFDRQFFGGNGKPMLCTLKAARKIWPDAPKHSNQVLRYWLKLPVDREIGAATHDAGSDAYVTAHILKALLQAGATVQDMIKWTNEPSLLTKMPFGKHKDTPFDKMPRDYLEWIKRQDDIDPDVKFTACQHIKPRQAAFI